MITKDDFLEYIHKLNLFLLFKSAKSSQYKHPDFITAPEKMLVDISNFVNQNHFYYRGGRKNVIEVVVTIIVKHAYSWLESHLPIACSFDKIDIQDLEIIKSIILEYKPEMFRFRSVDFLEIQPSYISASFVDDSFFYNRIIEFSSQSIVDFFEDSRLTNFVTAAKYFALLLNNHFQRMKVSFLTDRSISVRQVHIRHEEVLILSRERIELFKLSSFVRISKKEKKLNDLNVKVNKLFIKHAAEHTAVMSSFKNVQKNQEDLQTKIEEIELFLNVVDVNNGLATLHRVSVLLMEFFEIVKNLKKETDVYRAADSEHVLNAEDVKKTFEDFRSLWVQSLSNDIIAELKLIPVLNYSEFISIVTQSLITNKKDYKETLTLLGDSIRNSFSRELLPEKDLCSIESIKNYCVLLMERRQALLDDLLLEAVATINLQKLKKYINNQNEVENDDGSDFEDSKKFETFRLEDETYFRIRNVIYLLNYNEVVVRKSLCHEFNIEVVLSEVELLEQVQSVIATVKQQFETTSEELNLLYKYSQEIEEKLRQEDKRTSERSSLISNYKSLACKLLIVKEQERFNEFVAEIERDLAALYQEENTQLAEYLKKSSELRGLSINIQDKISRLEQLTSTWSLESFAKCCESLVNEFCKYKKMLHRFEGFVKEFDCFYSIFKRIDAVDAKIMSSILKFFDDEPLIRLIEIVKKSKIFEQYTYEVFDMYDKALSDGLSKEKSLERVAGQLAKAVHKNLEEIVIQRRFFMLLNLDELPPQDAHNIRRLLNLDIFIDVRDAEGLKICNNNCEISYSLYLKYGKRKRAPSPVLIESSPKMIVLNPFSEYSNNNDSCGLFFTRPVLHFSLRRTWYRELECQVGMINAHLRAGDVSSLSLQSFMFDLIQNIENKIRMSDISSTFLRNILKPLMDSVKEVNVDLVASKTPAVFLMAKSPKPLT